MIATIANRATIIAAPSKAAPTLGGAGFALSIAGLVGATGEGGDAPADPALATATPDDPATDRHADAESGTTLPGAAPTLDPALAWLPFAPVEAPMATPIPAKAPTPPTTTLPLAAIATRATAPAITSSTPARPAADIDLPDKATPDAPVVALTAGPVVPPSIAPQPIPVQPVIVQPTLTQSTTISAIATSSLTPIPLVTPRIDGGAATMPIDTGTIISPVAAPTARTADPAAVATPIDTGAIIAPVAVPMARTADPAAVAKPIDTGAIIAPVAAPMARTAEPAAVAMPIDIGAIIAPVAAPTTKTAEPAAVATPIDTGAVIAPVAASTARTAEPAVARRPVDGTTILPTPPAAAEATLSSPVPIPLVAPRIDDGADVVATPVATAAVAMPNLTPIDTGAVTAPMARTTEPAVTQRPIDDTTILPTAPAAAEATTSSPRVFRDIPRASQRVDDAVATIAAAATPVIPSATTPMPIATPARFQMAATTAVDAPVPTSPATGATPRPATPPAEHAPVATVPLPPATSTPAQPLGAASQPVVPVATPIVVPPLPIGFPTTQPALVATALPPTTPVIAAAASVPTAPASFLRQIAADTPVTPLAVVPPPTEPTAPGIVFGVAIRAAASASDDKPALVATDPLGPIATPVAEVRTVTATANAQQAPLDMSQGRWPHAMIDRIEQLRDAASAVDTRIRLVPDALGQIDVSIRQDGGTTHVSFVAEQAATRTMLQDAAPRLAAIAEERGLKLSQSTTDASAQQHQSGQRHAAQQSAANRAPTSIPTDRDTATDDGDDRLA